MSRPSILMRLPRLAAAAGLALALSLGASPGRAADTATEAVTLVTRFCDSTLQIVSDPQAGAAARERRFRQLIDDHFDFPAIARFVLGRHWQTASEEERRAFTAAFQDHMVRANVERFSDLYDGETFTVRAARADGAGVTIVPVQILRPGGQPPVVLDWQVQQTQAGLRIRDVGIAGVSMARTYRDEFAAVVQRGDGRVAVLIAALRGSAD
jgi:phospholipid transport system substrate-binding protein